MRVGITGSGQLGWMMILEGRKLGLEFNVAGPSDADPAARISDRYFDYAGWREFVDSSHVITYEFEHVPREILSYAETQGKLFPPLSAVDLKKDRSEEKRFYINNGIPTADYVVADNLQDAIHKSGRFRKAMVKQCVNGYDGKGQAVVENGRVLSGSAEGKCIVEEYIDYDFEASIISYRDMDGNMGAFQPSLNVNTRGMLLYNEAPSKDYGMKRIAEELMESLDYVGVMGVEFFVRNGEAMVNEFSPRVHNSGHHTLMGSSVSQFEQHVRILASIPTVIPVLYRPSGIVNIIGKIPANIYSLLSGMEAKPYIYGKEERRRRKLGHVNITSDTTGNLHDSIMRVKDGIYGHQEDLLLSP